MAKETRRDTKPTPMPLGKAIRQAGEGTITKPELKGILDSAKSSGQFVQKLDTINQNLKEKDRTGISLGSGATNMLIREASKQSPTGYNAYLSNIMGPAMGTGRLGTELQRRATEFGTTGSMGSLVPRGMSTMPSGRLTLPGVGPQFELPKVTVKNPLDLDTGRTKPDGTTEAITTTTTPEVEQEPMTPEAMQANSTIGIGADLSNWATGFRRKQGSRGRAGRSAQGLASQRVLPTANVLGY